MFILLAARSFVTTAFIPLIVAVSVPALMFGINAWHKKVVKKQNTHVEGANYKVRHNRLVFGCLIFLIALMGVVTLLFPVLYLLDLPDGPPLEVVIAVAGVAGVFTIISALLYMGFKRCGILVSNEKIEHTPFIGKVRCYAWEDISRIVALQQPFGSATVYTVYVKQSDKKAFAFSSFFVGGDKFADDLRGRGFLL